MSESNHQARRAGGAPNFGRYGSTYVDYDEGEEEYHLISRPPPWTKKHWFHQLPVFMTKFISPITGHPDHGVFLATSLRIRPNGFLWVPGLMKFHSSSVYRSVFGACCIGYSCVGLR